MPDSSNESDLQLELDRVKHELREVQRSYRDYLDLANFAPDLVWQVDTKGICTYVSPSILDITGFAAEDVIGQPYTELLDPASARKFQTVLREKLDSKPNRDITSYELSYRRKNGSMFLGEVRSALYFDDNRNIVGMQGITRDVTDKRQMENELNKTEKLQSIGVMAGGIAHDLNNFLTGIVGNIGLARLAREAKKRDELLATAENEAMRVRGLTQQLLTFAKGGNPQTELRELSSLLRETVNFTLSGSNVRADFQKRENPCVALIDEGQIRQVINNLVINAIQAMPEGGTIEVSITRTTVAPDALPIPAGQYHKIDIADEGTGIPEENLQQIFDPFFSTKAKGNGLGLATAFSIVKRHGGHLTVASSVGVGSVFSLYLPIAAGEPRASVPDRPIEGNTGKVLMMDDEAAIRELAERALATMGFEAVVCADGESTIHAYQEAMDRGVPFDVVVLDLTVPGGMGGVEAAIQLKKLNPAIKLILASGYSNDEVISNYTAYGFNKVITKPYRLSDLGQAVNELIHEAARD